MNTVYLDNNATTRIATEVLDAMMPYLTGYYGNPSSMHSFGGRVAPVVEEARGQVARLIGASPDEIIFTSCGTESDNTAVRSALAVNPEKRHIVTSRVEHPAVRELCLFLARNGYRITEVPVDSKGRLDMDAYRESLTDDTALVTLMWANNETGVIFPVEEAAGIARERGILVHTDAVQAVGKVPIDVDSSGVDMLSLSGHKLHAPKGIGVLYVRKGTRFVPFLIGGHQELERRAGTENVPYIAGLGKACERALDHLPAMENRVRKLRDKLEREITSRIPHATVNGDKKNRLPNTSNISFKFVEGESILLMMNEYGICASSGSACTSGSLQPSHVMLAMGVPFTMAHGSIRFSLSIYSEEAEIDFVVEKLESIMATLRAMSPFWNEDSRPADGR
ncbi:MAG: cysteine desulfurase NifS [delta proteobacterium MLS_D]|jgi:cysteine desulfurase|nr:MAG: cysteine desulfurase NifS [delta proteobacterium MLS_D]